MGIGDLKDYRYKTIYNIDGNYDTLTGLFAIDFESKDCTADNFGAQFLFWEMMISYINLIGFGEEICRLKST